MNNQAQTVTLYYTKLFLSGPLKGLCANCSVTLPTVESFRGRWMLHSEGKDCITNDRYRIVDRSFQNYAH